jgi:hypothetical protein
MKKKYIKPSVVEYEMKPSRLICTSDNWGYAPTIPGQPDDEKQLA